MLNSCFRAWTMALAAMLLLPFSVSSVSAQDVLRTRSLSARPYAVPGASAVPPNPKNSGESEVLSASPTYAFGGDNVLNRNFDLSYCGSSPWTLTEVDWACPLG